MTEQSSSVRREDYQSVLKFSKIEDLHSAVRYFGTGSHQPALNKNLQDAGESHAA